MAHQHTHDHSHGDSINFNKAFVFGISLNVLYVIAECYYGFKINSLALLSDAGHNVGDVLSLLLAWAAEFLVKRKAFGQFTYGLKRASIVIAFINTLMLVLALGAISWEAVHRLNAPVSNDGLTMAWVAMIGIMINGFTAYLFYQPSSHDINIKSAFWHMAADALVSAGVVLAGVLIHYTGWLWLDPMVSIVIVLVVLLATWSLLKNSSQLILDAAPPSIRINDVKKYLETLSGVQAIHDLHVWNLSTKQTALTVHLIIPSYQTNDLFLKELEHELHHRFGISHVTVQIEVGNDCALNDKNC